MSGSRLVAFRESLTPVFRLWWRLSRPMTLGVRAIIEDEQGRVCLVRHTYKQGLFLPGGGVERGESIPQALCKECREEVGADPEAFELIGVFRHPGFRGDHIVLYRVRRWRSCPTDSAGEIAERLWVDPLDPPEDATPATLRRLAELYAGQAPAVDW
ncbi:MAG: NUDIX domain-containing protein [Pseudomonadota bacterium]